MTNMSLSVVTTVAGCAVAIIAAPCILAPTLAQRWLKAFPRSKQAGWALVAVGLAWVAFLVFRSAFVNTFLDRIGNSRPWVYFLVPVAYVLIVVFMDELLAVRALGGLMLLIPAPILIAAQRHDSPLRFVVVVLAYTLVIAGIVLVLSPYYFRKVSAPAVVSARVCRICGLVGAALGLCLIVLALTAFGASPAGS